MSNSSADEVVRYISSTFQSAFADPTLATELTLNPVRVRFGVVDPDCVLVIDAARHEVRLGCTSDEPTTAMVAMNGDTAHRYWLGQVDVEKAMASGDIAAAGEVAPFLSLVGSRSRLPQLYAEVLRREGREDLLVS